MKVEILHVDTSPGLMWLGLSSILQVLEIVTSMPGASIMVSASPAARDTSRFLRRLSPAYDDTKLVQSGKV
jgi:hypothetical protein